jgi:transposase
LAISKDKEAEILRFHFVEGWRVGTISSQLNIHHYVVERVISQAGQPKVERTNQASMIDDFLPFITETLEKYPTLTAARLFDMVKARGYPGCSSHFRQRIAQLRPRPQPEAYLRLKTLPGEQGQVDWGSFGSIQIGEAKRALAAFVMVLSWSRQIFLKFYLNQQMESFLRGHVSAFEFFAGVPKVLLYDNLRSAVLERRGDTIRFHPTLLDLSAHYRYEPRPVAVARGNEKGRVERAIRFIRDNFFAGREWQNLDDLNDQAKEWCLGRSADRLCPEDKSMTVRQAFEQEQPTLLSLPDNPFPSEERVVVSSGKTPYIRFDLNDYSIPYTYVRRQLTVVASLDTVSIVDGDELVAQHKRCYGKAEQIENPSHINELLERKYQARCHRGQDRLANAVPSSGKLLSQAVERGNTLSSLVSQLVHLLDDYGAAELELAVVEALQQHVPHPNAVRQALERRREEKQQPPPLAIVLPNNTKAQNLVVRPASLAVYDKLNQPNEEEDENNDENLEEENNGNEAKSDT